MFVVCPHLVVRDLLGADPHWRHLFCLYRLPRDLCRTEHCSSTSTSIGPRSSQAAAVGQQQSGSSNPHTAVRLAT
jgi:hypothetical protein